MFENGNLFLWLLQWIITLSLTYLAIWLFFSIKYQNRNKKWFKVIFSGKEWQPILQSIELLDQIKSYQNEGIENSNL